MKRSAMPGIGTLLMMCYPWTPVAIAATDGAKQAAIHNGLAYLYKTQQASGSWSDSGYEHAATGAAAFALLSQQDKWGTAGPVYQNAVDNAIAYLLSEAKVAEVSTREDGLKICPEESSSCKGISWNDSGETIVSTSLVAPAIAIYGSKLGPDAVATNSGPLAGMTWAQIAQGITNAYAASQSTGRNGTRNGAWLVFVPGFMQVARWTTEPAVMSFLYDQRLGAVTPQVVKDALADWVTSAQGTSGAVCDERTGGSPCELLEAGEWLLSAWFSQLEVQDTQVQSVLANLNRRWTSNADKVWHGNFGNPYVMWTVYAGLQGAIGVHDSTGIVNFLTNCGAVASTRPTSVSGTLGCTWAEDYNEWIVTGQRLDGSWAGHSYWSTPLASALYVNILGAIEIPSAAYECPLRQAFWQMSRLAWPVDSLGIGGRRYSKDELLAILAAPLGAGGSEDASLLLADELITAKLNLARGSEKAPVAKMIADADMLLSEFKGSLPHQIQGTSVTGLNMIQKADLLDRYNGGAMTSGCMTGEGRKGTAGRLRRTDSPVQQGPTLVAASRSENALTSVGTAQKARETAAASKIRPFTRKGVTSISLSPDGNLLATASTDNRIRVWVATTGAPAMVLPTTVNFPTSLAFGPNGGTLNGVGRDSLVHMWSAASGTELATFAAHESALRAVAASSNGLIGSAGEETRIILWDGATHQLRRILFGSTDFVNALSFSPDGSLLASAGEDARVLLFDVAAGKLRYMLRGHSGPIDTVSFSPDGRLLASGGQDAVIHVWDAATGEQRLALAGPQARVRAIAFSPDSHTIAASGDDTRIILWNAVTGQIQKTLSGSTGAINALVFSPVGPFLISATETGEISVWNVASGTRVFRFVIPI